MASYFNDEVLGFSHFTLKNGMEFVMSKNPGSMFWVKVAGLKPVSPQGKA
jgi:hypothetical protein